MRRRNEAFTLLEVMAAVAILAIVFVSLAGSALHWIREQGVNGRRIEASLLADRVMAELEAQVAAGIAPPIDSEERDEDPYTVFIDVEPFTWEDLPADLLDSETTPDGRSDDGRGSRDRGRRRGSAESLLDERGAEASLVRRMRVAVAWIEGAGERSVGRTSFALDLEAAQPLLEPLAPNPDGGDDEGGDNPLGGDDDDRDDDDDDDEDDDE